jgi:general secretion pathway protein C
MNFKRILVLGNLVTMVLVFWMAVAIVISWVSQRQSGGFFMGNASSPPGSREAVPLQSKNLADYAVISEKDVFRSASVKDPTKSAGKEQAEIKVTELNLELKGTVVGEGRSSYAVILDRESDREDIYFQDDFLLGARISGITKTKVMLDLNGREEALLMTDESRTLPELLSSSQARPAPKTVFPPRQPIARGRGVRTPGK